MADQEKVIKGLEYCKSDYYCRGYVCPYFNKRHCIEELTHDALELIKAQEKRHKLEVHNIGNVEIPEGVTE